MSEEQVPEEFLLPLVALADELGLPYERLRRWSDTDRNNNFPREVERIGRVKFYDIRAVRRWVTLWEKTQVSKNSVRRGTKTG